MGSDPELPPCTSCGGCCYTSEPRYIGVYGFDLARMDELTVSYTTISGGKRFMRFDDGHCSALRIDEAAQRYECAVYEQRPDACHWLQRGSAECLAKVRAPTNNP